MSDVNGLSHFVGGNAQFWYWNPSHGRLVVRLAAEAGVIRFLILSFCERIQAPTSWTIRQPRIDKAGTSKCEFLDADVRITCGEAGVFPSFAEDPTQGNSSR